MKTGRSFSAMPTRKVGLALLSVILFSLLSPPQVFADSLSGSEKASQNTPAPALAASAQTRSAPAGPLRVLSANPRYFTDGSGRAVVLTGSHTWLNFQDGLLTDPPPAFDYTGYLDYLVAQNHNFFRLWVWENAKYSVEASVPYYMSPMPYQRTGPGTALDGKPKYNLNAFNQAYFDRLRARVIEARDKGFYVSVMLFNGWSVSYPKASYIANNPWVGHPFHKDNNINGINGDGNNNNSGDEVHTLANSAVTAYQDAYVKKVIDTVNDLDNVLYEIANETNNGQANANWQYHMIDLIHSYEAGKAKQHPVGMTAMFPNGNNSFLTASNAEWISPAESLDSPPAATGNKVIISDTDHHCGICGSRVWVWKSFTRGENPIFMDQYDGHYFPNNQYNRDNANDVSLRQNMGAVLRYGQCINLAGMTPRGDLTSTTYALAKASATSAEYLVYAPSGGTFSVNLSATSTQLSVQWFNPATLVTTNAAAVNGGAQRNFTPPFSGDAVLYLKSVQVFNSSGLNNKVFFPFIAAGTGGGIVCTP